MFEVFDIKFLLALLSTVITVAAFSPYLRDIFLKKTRPHAYTWLVWAITQSTATVVLWYGGGNFAAISLTVGTLLVLVVFFLSLEYGTKNITRSDTFVLVMALLAIVVWWKLGNPLLAVIMVSIIDGLGYIPSFRKSFQEPWTETLSFWGAMAIASLLALLANGEYNFLTVTYLATLTIANTILLTLCAVRRRTVSPSFPKALFD